MRHASAWLFPALLTGLPVAVYSNTIWSRFGWRDDYSSLREAAEEPGKIETFCGSKARPLYGWLLQKSFERLDGIDALPWARALGALCVGLAAASVYLGFVSLYGWGRLRAAFYAALLAVLPGSQVIVSWAICWPIGSASVLAALGFFASEAGFRTGGWTKAGWIALGQVALIASAWIYQTNALFCLVFVTAGLFERREREPSERVRWLVHHASVIGGALALAYVFIRFAFTAGWIPMSRQIAFEPHLLEKWIWFLSEPLVNALAVLVLNDDGHRTEPLRRIVALSVAAVIAAAWVSDSVRRGWKTAVWWPAAFIVLTTAAYGISIIAAERFVKYRTLLPLTAVVLLFFVYALDEIGRRGLWPGNRLATLVLAALLVTGIAQARLETHALIALRQAGELEMIERAARDIDPTRPERIFIITPTVNDPPAPLVVGDEFGSLSTNSDWVPKEMLKMVLHDRSNDPKEFGGLKDITLGPTPPRPHSGYDQVIDLRRSRELAHSR